MVMRETNAGLEVFCIERAKGSRFLGGAIVFPGGKVDPGDHDLRWDSIVRGYVAPTGEGEGRYAKAIAICAMRECFEETCMLHAVGLGVPTLLEWHDAATTSGVPGLLERLTQSDARVDLSSFLPISRWITPVAEARRFDTRFFLARAPDGQEAKIDGGEATRGVWGTPKQVLAEFATGRIALFPPTHRMLEMLEGCRTWEDAVGYARSACLLPICPEVVKTENTVALVMPGDPEHSIHEPRIAGRSRYVLRGEQWLPEDSP